MLAGYGEKTLNAADPLRHIGLRELVAECARMEGIDVPRVFGDGTATIRAGFSSMSLPSIMENVMNKTLLAAYQNTPIAAFDLCSVGTVTDFKEVARYRLLGTGGFEQVAPDGELKHGKLSEQKYSNKADTYGQILTLTRHDIINDDLSAFMDIPRQMGRSGAESIDDLFFTLLLKNAGFFSSANANLLQGADTKFGPDALTVAKTTFRKQKAGPGGKPKDQKPINIRPEFLVVPVELETEAELLMGSSQLMIDAQGSPTKIPVDNPHRNKYRIISTPHLSDSYYPGASAAAWYLFATPQVLPAFEIVFLNGRRTPIIERVEMPPNTLGMGFRSYIDFGVNSQDHRAAVKVAGE
ncbi:Mu-like prophage major head subunit gpT family protein [Rubripirellula sp.]|nr:Mu-like prophage major head subunit gpT family protein [Rubripirellula sp.]